MRLSRRNGESRILATKDNALQAPSELAPLRLHTNNQPSTLRP